jgi:hypothetical protein
VTQAVRRNLLGQTGFLYHLGKDLLDAVDRLSMPIGESHSVLGLYIRQQGVRDGHDGAPFLGLLAPGRIKLDPPDL